MHTNSKVRWLALGAIIASAGCVGWIWRPSIAAPLPELAPEIQPIPTLPPEFPPEPVNQANQVQSNLMPLVQHLKQRGVKMYGADWCGFYQRQKALLGDAFQEINYIECDPNSLNGQPLVCEKANIQVYPTWEINGRFFQGVRTPEELAFLSGFPGKL